MYISETSRHVFHSEKGSLHGGKWSGRLEDTASYVCVCVSECVTRAGGGCRRNAAEGCLLCLAVILAALVTHTNTYPLWSYTCPGCIIENGRQRTRHTRQREQEGGKPSCSLYVFLSSNMGSVMQSDDMCLVSSNHDCFPKWIVYSHMHYDHVMHAGRYSRWTMQLTGACGPQARVMLCGF